MWACVCGYMPVTEGAPLPWPGRCLTAPQGSLTASRAGPQGASAAVSQHRSPPPASRSVPSVRCWGASCRGPGSISPQLQERWRSVRDPLIPCSFSRSPEPPSERSSPWSTSGSAGVGQPVGLHVACLLLSHHWILDEHWGLQQ